MCGENLYPQSDKRTLSYSLPATGKASIAARSLAILALVSIDSLALPAADTVALTNRLQPLLNRFVKRTFDLVIILRTFRVVLKGVGAY